MSITDVELDQLAEFFKATKGETIWVGIDPGASGAIAFIASRDYVVFDIPVIKIVLDRKTKSGEYATRTEFDYAGICSLFSLVEKNDPSRMRVLLERGSGRPGDTVLTSFVVGVGYGMWPLFLHRLGLRFEPVMPVTWKRAVGLAGRAASKALAKEMSRALAMKRFPRAPLAAKSHHNRAEALLLADYLRSRDGDSSPKRQRRRAKAVVHDDD